MANILTWNMEGGQTKKGDSKWANLKTYVNKTEVKPDVICLQECSHIPEWGGSDSINTGYLNYGTESRPNYYYGVYYPWGTGTDKVSFAILIRTIEKPSGETPKDYELVASIEDGGRPMIGIKKGSFNYYTIHAPSYHPIDVPRSRTYIQGMVRQVKMQREGESFIIGGDFNCTPADMRLFVPEGATLYASDKTTHPAKGNTPDAELDYFISNLELSDMDILDLGGSDHYAVLATFDE